MKMIPLTKGLMALVDDADYEFLMHWKWTASSKGGRFYAIRGEGPAEHYRHIYMHRVIAGAVKGQEVDHEDRCTLNNQRYNLRICNSHQNHGNLPKPTDNKSGFKGVHFDSTRKLWASQVAHKYVGRFKSAEEAARAYDIKAKEVFGDFAATNESLGLLPRRDEQHA